MEIPPSLNSISDRLDRTTTGSLAALLLATALPFLGLGVFMGWQSLTLSGSATRLQGQVVRHEERMGSDEQVSYAPVVRFTAPDGRSIEFTSSTGSSRRRHEPGDPVHVLYDPASDRAEIRSFTTMWLFPVALTVAGTLLLSLAAVAVWFGVVIHRRKA